MAKARQVARAGVITREGDDISMLSPMGALLQKSSPMPKASL